MYFNKEFVMNLKQLVVVGTVFLCGCSELGGVKALDSQTSLPGVRNPIEVDKPDLVKGVDLGNAIGSARDLSKAAMLTDEDVEMMALQFTQYADSKNKVAPASNRYAKRLARLIAKHQQEDGLNLDYKVYMNSNVNAVSMANGSIRIFSGLMDAMRDQELLAVIGHEIGHIKLKHSFNKTRAAMMASAARKGVASMDSDLGAIAGSEVGGLLEKVLNSQYSQSAEYSSDAYALKFLLKHNYDGQGAVNAMYKLAKIQRESGSDGASILSSHPGARDRAKRLASLLTEAKSNPGKLDVVIQENSGSEGAMASLASSSTSAMASDAQNVPSSATGSSDSMAALKASSGSGTKTATLSVGAGSGVANSMSDMQKPDDLMSAMNNTPPKQPEMSADSLQAGWYLQISAETDESLARRKVELLRSEGLSVETQRAVVRGQVYIRVLVGPYPNRYTAESKSRQAKLAGVNDGEPFVRRVR
jgi:putative metalloprotease